MQQDPDLAGPEINQLAKRYSYDTDAERMIQATRIWRATRSSQASKVKLIRSLDLPETVILDFLSDDFHSQVRMPRGPRNENEVRVRAARRLLQLELPPESAMPFPRPPADQVPGRAARTFPSRMPNNPAQRGR